MNKITRKNRRQKGGIYIDPEDPEGRSTGLSTNFSEQLREAENLPDNLEEEPTTTKQEEENKGWFSNPFKNPFKGIFSSTSSEPVAPVYGGNKKQPNPAFGGYLKGGKQKRRTTKKRAGGNKCKCGCRNCRCSIKNCKCKCADKRFKCICKSSTCGCKRTLKRRKH